MTAPTASVGWVLARAAVRSTGILHLTSRRDSGALNPICGANPIRSTRIETHATVPADVPVCGDCTTFVAQLGSTVDAALAGGGALALLEVPIAQLTVPTSHPRSRDGLPDSIHLLTDSIRQHGVLQPILVRTTDGGYDVVAGARRLAAATAAGLATVPAIVRDVDDAHAAVEALVENLHRADLNPIELAHAYMHALSTLACSKTDLARRLGISRPQVSNTIRLLGLAPEDQARVASGELTAADGRARLADKAPKSAVKPLNPVPLADVATALGQAWDARVLVTSTARRDRIVIDVPHGDLTRILVTLGIRTEQTA